MKKEAVPISCRIDKKNARIALSPQCNLACNYCEGPQGRRPDKPGSMEDFRASGIETGNITSEQYLSIMTAIMLAGLRGVTFTGGEPMLNLEWPELVKAASQMGFKRVEMTTNGTLLLHFLEQHGKLPLELTNLKVSLDTHDPDKFRQITKVGDLNQVTAGIEQVRQTSPDLNLRANKVLLRSDLPEIKHYLDFIEHLGMNEVIFLDLILTDAADPAAKRFFEREFVSIAEVIPLLKRIYGNELTTTESRYGPKLYLPSGLPIILKDSNGLTLRDEACYQCPITCQEGMFTTRVATDGAIRLCYDQKNQLKYVDGRQILEDQNQAILNTDVEALVARMIVASGQFFFPTFLNKAGVSLKSEPQSL